MNRMKDVNGPFQKEVNEPDRRKLMNRIKRMKDVNGTDEKDEGSEWTG